jgi:hypothetical protein
MTTEDDAEKLEFAVLNALTGLSVEVVAGPILKDTSMKPLTHEGALAVLDRLRARGFRVERV